MEMQEKKKLMPTITNYLSDDDDLDECTKINSTNPQSQTNYAEWKRLQKCSEEISNGKKPRVRSDGTIEPLGDISSSDDCFAVDDNEPMFKIIKNLAEKNPSHRRNHRTRPTPKQPSRFFLFSRMKHLKYQSGSQDWTFSELCRITHSSWENIQPVESEELDGTMDQRIQEYHDLLLKFRASLLPDSTTGRLKYKSWVSAAVATKEQHPAPIAPVDAHKDSAPPIPERLQNLAGKASVYHATPMPNRSNPNARHSLFSYRSTTSTNNNDYSSATSLNYVANVSDSCEYESCTNKPVQDYRWDGQYCSARCLIEHCRDAFNSWLADQRTPDEPVASHGDIVNGTGGKSRSSSTTGDNEDDEEEIMQYLASPTQEDDRQRRPRHQKDRLLQQSDSDDSISRDENLFASLQQHYFPSGHRTGGQVVDITQSDQEEDDDDENQNRGAAMKQRFPSAEYISLMTDIDGDCESLSPMKLHRSATALHCSPDLCSSSQCTSVAISSHSEG